MASVAGAITEERTEVGLQLIVNFGGGATFKSDRITAGRFTWRKSKSKQSGRYIPEVH